MSGKVSGRLRSRNFEQAERVRLTLFRAGCMSNSDLPLSIALGVGLAAATGFRIFLPMLIFSVAAYMGHLSLDERLAWLATSSALITLSVAGLLEIVAYYVPVVDNLLDTLATPASMIAGTVESGAVMSDVPLMVK